MCVFHHKNNSCGTIRTMKKKIILPLLLLFVLNSCKGSETSSIDKKISISRYVSQVSDTVPYRVSKKDEGKRVNYVVSSYPAIASARAKDNSLSIYSDIRSLFSEKYSTQGFPQAGLFIKKSLAKDDSKRNEINSFLSAVNSNRNNLINNPKKARDKLDSLRPDKEDQKNKFGRNSSLALSIQKDNKNGFGFIDKDNQPDQAEYDKFSTIFDLDWNVQSFSAFYFAPQGEAKRKELTFDIAAPRGAPSLAFSSFATSDRFITEAPNLVKAEFAKGEMDFIIFDSVNGRKLAKDNYEFVSRITYGNLYVISLGNDENEKRDSGDYIVSYGEGLIPDLAFKSVYDLK